jgi:hypothetical protein
MQQSRPETGGHDPGSHLRGAGGGSVGFFTSQSLASTPGPGGAQQHLAGKQGQLLERPRLTLHGGVDPLALKGSVAAATRRAQLVDLEALLRFVFPHELQHAMSTGRLLAFGFYGPLDSEGQLRSGHKGSHVLQRWELDTMCRQFEREDILQVFVHAASLASQAITNTMAKRRTPQAMRWCCLVPCVLPRK